jgi:HAD superfamily hydrolase (TIGR01509 family)
MPAIIFDFDGVIVDSEPMHEAALRETLRAEGMDFSPQEYRAKYLGFDDRDICVGVARSHGRTLSDSDLAHLMRLKCQKTMDAIAAGIAAPFPGSIELLKAAAAAAPTAICSGARREEIDAVLARLGVLGLAKTIVSADDVAKSKPDPESYRLVVERLGGVKAQECVAIEDTAWGVQSAVGAGVRVVAVCHSMTGAELAKAHRVVASTLDISLAELLAMANGGAPGSRHH